MAPKAEKKVAEKKPAAAEKAPAEKKPKAGKKLPKDTSAAAAGDKKKKRKAKSVETYKIYIFKVLKQVHPDIGISSKESLCVSNVTTNFLGERMSLIFMNDHFKRLFAASQLDVCMPDEPL